MGAALPELEAGAMTEFSGLPYDEAVVRLKTKELIELMLRGREARSFMALLPYVDDHGERGCKLLFEAAGEPHEAVVDAIGMYTAALTNMAASIDSAATNISRHVGPDAEKKFRDALRNIIRESSLDGLIQINAVKKS
jgi:hypothetical protein